MIASTIRSALLEVIADTPEEDVYIPAGKERMQKRMTAAINKVLVTTEGFGGVDAVYFTGGSTGLGALSERIAAQFPNARAVHGNRFSSVAQGLGQHAANLFLG